MFALAFLKDSLSSDNDLLARCLDPGLGAFSKTRFYPGILAGVFFPGLAMTTQIQGPSFGAAVSTSGRRSEVPCNWKHGDLRL